MKTLLIAMIWFTILVFLAGGCRSGTLFVPKNGKEISQVDLEEAAEIVNECLRETERKDVDVLPWLKEFKIQQTPTFVCYAVPVLGCFLPPARVEFTMYVHPKLKAKRVKASAMPHELLHLALFNMGNLTADFAHEHPCFERLQGRMIEELCAERQETVQEANPNMVVKCSMQSNTCVCTSEPKHVCHKPDRSCK